MYKILENVPQVYKDNRNAIQRQSKNEGKKTLEKLNGYRTRSPGQKFNISVCVCVLITEEEPPMISGSRFVDLASKQNGS